MADGEDFPGVGPSPVEYDTTIPAGQEEEDDEERDTRTAEVAKCVSFV